MITPEKDTDNVLVPVSLGAYKRPFDEKHVLHELKHYLPTQTPLKDFIHHNSLHAFQQHKFFDALFHAGDIFGFQTTLQLSEFRELFHTGRIRQDILERTITELKGTASVSQWLQKLLHTDYDASVAPRIGSLRKQWKALYQVPLDDLVQPLLFRVLCSYLDQGIASWRFPLHTDGFLAAVRSLDKNSYTSFFRTGRAKKLLHSADLSIHQLLSILVGREEWFEQYLFDQQFTHRGWSGMVCAVEAQPHSLLDRRQINLHDLIIFELLMEIDALDARLGTGWKPLAIPLTGEPANLFAETETTELQQIFTLWQQAFEWSYYDEVIAGMQQLTPVKDIVKTNRTFQAMFCIDERECSLRRHIEQVDVACETFGTPGFFGVEFYFQPENGKFYDKLCPAPVTPVYLIKETGVTEHRKHEALYSGSTHTFLRGSASTLTLGFFAAVRLIQQIFRPKMSPAISNAFTHMTRSGKLLIETEAAEKENGLQLGFTVEEMTTRVEGLLRGIGLLDDFAPIVYVIAHGSSSANNPHHGAHDCGACSGRPGSVNARVFSFMANHAKVRAILKERGITVPDSTRFIGALHDTASDQVEYYDDQEIDADHLRQHEINRKAMEHALDRNAKERSRRFASIDTRQTLKKVRKAILDRSVSMFEPRPELGHGTNTLCIIGRRDLTKGLFLDRRAFLNSYDYRTDPEGKRLGGIMRPIGPVCGGINLEYYFSRVDNYKLGAGTKLPHNVMGLIGVANSSDGDLRPGLPVQMIEVHDPVRLLVIVEHYPDVVLQTIRSAPEMYEWYGKEWIHLMVKDPVSGQFYYFRDGEFVPYKITTSSVAGVDDLTQLIESAKEMESNFIVHATKENLPVYTIQ